MSIWPILVICLQVSLDGVSGYKRCKLGFLFFFFEQNCANDGQCEALLILEVHDFDHNHLQFVLHDLP
jgi:hypothetical protein